MGTEKDRVCTGCGNALDDDCWGGDCAWCLLQLGLTKVRASFSTSSASAPSQVDTQLEPLPGKEVLTRFGDYELVSEIARGGMGVVYRARQLSLGRQVAVKMILAGQLATRESLERFRLEAQSAARLHHAGIVRIYEIGEFETQYFYSMELIDGESLAECLEEFQLDPKADAVSRRTQEMCIAELIAKVARALDFAHRHGVLHRDLKPSNILIDQEGEPHLTDFGLAKLMGTEDSGLSLSNAVLGTPGYVAPEQASGSRHVTIAADVYGLGATLYELLAGQPPFLGSSAMATMMQAIQQDAKSARSHNPTVDRDLDTIALRCLEREPKHRYASAAEVAEELERYLRHEPIRARSVSSWESVWRWCSRNPGIAFLLVCLVSTFMGGTASVLWQWGRAERANTKLAEGVERLRWYTMDDMLRTGQAQRGLAGVAAMLRRDPENWKAATFGMSIMEQYNFPIPYAPEIRQTGELSVARISPDGATIATASFDGTVRLLDSRSSLPKAPDLKHDASVTQAAFSPDSQFLATGTVDGQVQIWRVSDGTTEGSTIHVSRAVDGLRYSLDGKLLLLKSRKSVDVYDVQTRELKLGPLSPSGTVVAASIAEPKQQSHRLFLAIQDGTASRLQLWDIDANQLLVEIKTGPIIHACISSDLTHAASIDHQKITLWDLASGTKKQEIESQQRLQSIEFNKDGTELLVSGFNDWARVWAKNLGPPITPELTHYYIMNGANFVGDGQRVLTWGDDSLAQVWNARSGERFAEPMSHSNRVRFAEAGLVDENEVFLTTLSHGKSPNASTVPGAAQLWKIHNKSLPEDRSKGLEPQGYDGIAISPDGRWLALAKTTQEVWVLETATGKLVCGPLRVEGGAWGLMFSKDQTKLIATTSRGQVSIWSVPDGKLLQEPQQIRSTIQPTELASDGKRFGTGSVDGFVRVWDVSTGRTLIEMKHGSEINSIGFSPDSRWIASAGEDHRVQVWDSQTGNRKISLVGHKNEVMRVRFTPDGLRIITASLDRTARVWDIETGQVIHQLPHNGEVIDIDISPNGQWIATASRDRTAMIWDAKSGKPHARSLFHEQGVRNVVFSLDGKTLLTRDFRGLRLWDVAMGIPLTVHLKHLSHGGSGFQSTSCIAQFTPEGERVFIATDSPDALLWHLPRASGVAPPWFAEFLEAVAGQRFIEGDDMVEAVPTSRFLELQQRLLSSQETDNYSVWARKWLAGSTD
jgi:WD40 repeat protein/tRNA A-37 threonylcarbamoyl transferase component Bud32